MTGIVPLKTPDGHDELARRTRRLGQRHRTVLLLVDGRRTVDQVLALALAAGVAEDHYRDLLALGLVALPDGVSNEPTLPMPLDEPVAKAEAEADSGLTAHVELPLDSGARSGRAAAAPAPAAVAVEPAASSPAPAASAVEPAASAPAPAAVAAPAARQAPPATVPTLWPDVLPTYSMAAAAETVEAAESATAVPAQHDHPVKTAAPAQRSQHDDTAVSSATAMAEPLASHESDADSAPPPSTPIGLGHHVDPLATLARRYDAPFEEARELLMRAVRTEAPLAGQLTLVKIKCASDRAELESLLGEVEARIARPRKMVVAAQTLRRVRRLLDMSASTAFTTY